MKPIRFMTNRIIEPTVRTRFPGPEYLSRRTQVTRTKTNPTIMVKTHIIRKVVSWDNPYQAEGQFKKRRYPIESENVAPANA